MNTDIITAQDMRAEAQALHLTCDNMNTSIHDILLQAKNHSDNVSADVNVITQSAQEMEAEIRNVTSCLAQKQLDVSNSMTAANQLKEKADSASSSQLKLIQIMLQINSNSLADVSQTLSSVTHADMLIKQVSIDLEQIEAMAQIESLIQDLQTQNLDINYLDQEITQLTSQLDGMILLLQESTGGANCNAK
uniref:Uncharacterized protein n=1 Tax=Arion vulgaris TaxID=1028688 RepID=A0A0B7A1D4_9EUPU